MKPEPSNNYYQNYQPSSPVINKTPEEHTPTNNKSGVHLSNNQRNGLIIAAAAFMVIALLSGVVMFFNKQNEDHISKTRQHLDALKSNQDNLKPTDNKPQTLFVPESPQPTTKQATAKPAKTDDRVIIKHAKTEKKVISHPQTSNARDDDAIFYACQSINDFESYLNSFPNGRHRTAAQNAINSLLGRNDNVANEAVTANEPVTRRRYIQDPPPAYRNTPPRRNSFSGGYDGGSQRPNRSYGGSHGSGMRSSGSRSGGGSSHRHSH